MIRFQKENESWKNDQKREIWLKNKKKKWRYTISKMIQIIYLKQDLDFIIYCWKMHGIKYSKKRYSIWILSADQKNCEPVADS